MLRTLIATFDFSIVRTSIDLVRIIGAIARLEPKVIAIELDSKSDQIKPRGRQFLAAAASSFVTPR
jgi:hypothetical protein